MDVVAIALTAFAAMLALPALVFGVQCLLGSPGWRDRPPPPTRPLRLGVLVPAHDEAAGIAGTVTNVLAQLGAGDRLIVIADNCRDDTAAVARAAATGSGTAAQCHVVERRDDTHRGKGHALAFGRAQLASDPPDVVVCIDADCRIVHGTLPTLAAWAMATGRPVQADYVLARGGDGAAMSGLGAFAVLVRNRVRPRGMARLGLPCQITGSGMALPWSRSEALHGLGANIVEDLVLGLESALAGHPPLGCPEVRVHSELPARDDDALVQRRRWEHGQMATAFAFAPRLLLAGLLRLRPGLLALAFDLLVPPLALLVAAVVATLLASAGLWLAGGSTLPLAVAGGAWLAVLLGTAVAWWCHGRAVLPWRQLLRVPLYVAWKLPLYFGLLRGRERAWRRTRRDGETP